MTRPYVWMIRRGWCPCSIRRAWMPLWFTRWLGNKCAEWDERVYVARRRGA